MTHGRGPRKLMGDARRIDVGRPRGVTLNISVRKRTERRSTCMGFGMAPSVCLLPGAPEPAPCVHRCRLGLCCHALDRRPHAFARSRPQEELLPFLMRGNMRYAIMRLRQMSGRLRSSATAVRATDPVGPDSEVGVHESDGRHVSNDRGRTRESPGPGLGIRVKSSSRRAWPFPGVLPGRDLGEHDGMDEAPVDSHITLSDPRQATGSGHRSRRGQDRVPFFSRDSSPLWGSPAYRTSKERDKRKTGPEQGLAHTPGLLGEAIEAISHRSGITPYFGFEDRILMIPSGRGPRRCVVAVRSPGSPGGLASRRASGYRVDSLSVHGHPGSVGRTLVRSLPGRHREKRSPGQSPVDLT
jgi:hypothetical protein